jgi:hypothetical protein
MNDIKYSIGYQLPGESDSIYDIVKDHRENIEEVYFAWLNDASGRCPVGLGNPFHSSEHLINIMKEELLKICGMGIRLTLLLNANCYGANAASTYIEEYVLSRVRNLMDILDIHAVTTTSPYIAKLLKINFPGLEIRASVNMRIGSIFAMDASKSFFDGFYMQRDYNRSPLYIKQLSAWCRENNKKIYMLVNSGCLRFCPFQTFHDNLVAHETEINPEFTGMNHSVFCKDIMTNEKNHSVFLTATWIRPEDIKQYAGLFDGYKLATRMHLRPRRIVEAYSRGRFTGNLLDLTEPGFHFFGKIIDNTLFPDDWYEKTSDCTMNCRACGYCKNILEKVSVPVEP